MRVGFLLALPNSGELRLGRAVLPLYPPEEHFTKPLQRVFRDAVYAVLTEKRRSAVYTSKQKDREPQRRSAKSLGSSSFATALRKEGARKQRREPGET